MGGHQKNRGRHDHGGNGIKARGDRQIIAGTFFSPVKVTVWKMEALSG
ncbi:hypothetical protein RWE15_21380 [Virgibacillus halophilus]|uniref:Uncharacterized protein n=1 Tax=Tigheibacillus halophilus TaxID=361280 RepID=A0ABU5CAP3_9BACI|nr:hypothetical protein [Virgibacillus halophilus]